VSRRQNALRYHQGRRPCCAHSGSIRDNDDNDDDCASDRAPAHRCAAANDPRAATTNHPIHATCENKRRTVHGGIVNRTTADGPAAVHASTAHTVGAHTANDAATANATAAHTSTAHACTAHVATASDPSREEKHTGTHADRRRSYRGTSGARSTGCHV
jgi:hypothetical protein